jgi:uncharacterized protein (TIGR00725 family)
LEIQSKLINEVQLTSSGEPMKVSVFGAANPKPGEKPYEDAYRLGKLLGEAGHTVLTGGYIGMMEAVSHGAQMPVHM